MKNRILVSILFLAAYGMLFCVGRAESASVVILSSTGYIASTGCYYVVGEVQNIGDRSLSYVNVTSTYYDNESSVIATDFAFTVLNVLVPGSKSPFRIILWWDEYQSARVDHYSLAISSFSVADTPEQALRIVSNSSYISAGALHIVGELQNTGTVKSTYNQIIATYYDSNGTVVGEWGGFTNPTDIEPGEKAPFDVTFIEYSRVPLISTYSLTAESTEYAFIPELQPMLTVLGLIIATSTVAIYLRHKQRDIL